MQDKWTEILGDITNNISEFEKLEHKIAPLMAEIKNNSENVDPELMKIYDKELEKLNVKRTEMEKAKEEIRNIKI